MAFTSEDRQVPPHFYDVPFSNFNHRSRQRLATFLNPERVNACGWRDLSEIMGFDYNDLEAFAMKDSPTEDLLRAWSTKGNYSIGDLVALLYELERPDMMEDMLGYAEKDVTTFLGRKAANGPVQDPSVSSEGAGVFLTTDDVIHEQVTIYDAFVLYDQNDLHFVRELEQRIEEQHRMKLFIKDRDEIPGMAQNTICAKLIDERCKRSLVIISRAFLESPFCEWLLQYAHALAPGASKCNKIIPVLVDRLRPEELPHILKPYTLSDYTKEITRQWFWDKLIVALKYPVKDARYTSHDDIQLHYNGNDYPSLPPYSPPPPHDHVTSPSPKQGSSQQSPRTGGDPMDTQGTPPIVSDRPRPQHHTPTQPRESSPSQSCKKAKKTGFLDRFRPKKDK